MQIWITEELNDLLLGDCLQVKLLPAKDVHDGFLAFAKARDMGIFPFTPAYRSFLASARKRGILGPVVFLASEPVAVHEDLYPLNAMVFSIRTHGAGWVRDTLKVIIDLASFGPALETPERGADDGGKGEAVAIEDPAAVRSIIEYAVRLDMPLVATYEIRESGEPVTVRGVCGIKEIGKETLVLDRFRQALFLRGIRKDGALRLVFPAKDRDDYGDAQVLGAGEKEVVTRIPARLYPTRDIRLQPNPKRPVTLYVLIPNEPTTSYKVTDISTKGMAFLCHRDLPVGAVYPLTLALPDPQVTIVCNGIIRFKKDLGHQFRYGAEIRPHPWDEEHLAQYIMKREIEIIGLLRGL